MFIRRYGDTDFITGLRAIAATMVIVIHTGALVPLGAWGEAMTAAGKHGVDMFLVISGYTVARTFSEARGYRAYLTRRLFRIVPLYWLMICVGLLMARHGIEVSYWMAELGARPDLYNLVMHFGLISYLDYTIANSALGLEWTIPVEVFWYLALPLVMAQTRTVGRTLGAIAILAVLGGAVAYACKLAFGTSLPVRWSPLAYGHWFFIGALTFVLRQRAGRRDDRVPGVLAWAAVAVFLVTVSLSFSGRGGVIGLVTAVALVTASDRSAPGLVRALSARPMLFLGSISYSLYLTHPVVIAGLRTLGIDAGGVFGNFLLVYAGTIAVSTLTYALIERPTNRLGHRVAARAAAAQSGLSSPSPRR